MTNNGRREKIEIEIASGFTICSLFLASAPHTSVLLPDDERDINIVFNMTFVFQRIFSRSNDIRGRNDDHLTVGEFNDIHFINNRNKRIFEMLQV